MSVKYIGPIKLAEPRHFFFLTEVDVQSHESKRMLGLSILPLVRFFFSTLELFRQCVSFILMKNFETLSANKFQNRYDTERPIR